VEALASADGDVRWAAARLIVEIGRLHAEVVLLLLGLVRSGDQAVVRRMAAFALRELAPDREDAARVLLDATRDADLQVRRAAFTAVASLATPPAGVVERLLEALREDDDAASRRLAALALGEIGRANPRAVSPEAARELGELEQRSKDPDLRRSLARARDRLAEGRAV
jgi:HEAT repeat protein